MSRLMNWFNQIQLRQTITVLLVGVVFFIGTACGTNTQATGATTTPEAGAYQTDLKGVDRSNNLSQTIQRVPVFATTQTPIILALDPQQSARRAQENAASAGKNQFAKSKEKTGNTLDNLREKLNLDEPLYPGTKKALNDTQSTAKEAAKGTQQNVEDTAKGTQRAAQDAADRVRSNRV